MAAKVPRVRWWRWRRNALRRRSDVLESWVGLIAAIVIVLGTPAAALTTASLVNDALQDTVRVQHSQRGQVPAVVLRAGPREVAETDPDSGQMQEARRTALARWTAPDGRRVTGTVRIPVKNGKGDTVRVWTDRQGRVVPPPLDAVTARTHAALAGMGAFLAAGVLLLVGRQMLMWQLMRRRLAEWEREWAEAGQDWGRAGRA